MGTSPITTRRPSDRMTPGNTFGNLGIGSDRVEVQETGDYHNADFSVTKRYTAGTMITRAEAVALGIVPATAPEREADVTPLDDAELGELYARCLSAAGYVVYREAELIEGEVVSISLDEQGEHLADALRAAGYDLSLLKDEAPPVSEPTREEVAEKRAQAEPKAEKPPTAKVEPPHEAKVEKSPEKKS